MRDDHYFRDLTFTTIGLGLLLFGPGLVEWMMEGWL